MRRLAASTAVLLFSPDRTAAGTAPGGPQHAWLFGAWVGGMFPPPVTLSAQECLAQPMVIFTRDVVMRAVMTSSGLRAAHDRYGARDRPPASNSAPVSGADPPPKGGFGCPNPDVLRVQRRGENEITFPGCADFPFPLIRCGSH